MEFWKNSTCGKCTYAVELPRQGIPDLNAPKLLICRKNPPQIVYAIVQERGGRPSPAPMGSMYPMIDETFIACSNFKLKVAEGTQVVGSLNTFPPQKED